MRKALLFLALVAVVRFPASLSAATINFDEFAATNNNTALTGLYAGLGVLFGSDNSGTSGGNSNGDPGNWDLEGTNGPAFLGNNGVNNGDTFVTTINFTSPVSLVSFDASRSNGSSSGQTLLASAYAGATLLGSQFVTLGDINTWSSFSFSAAGIDRLVLDGSESGFSPYGIDNLVFDAGAPVPEPGTLFLLGSGVLGLVGRYRRRI